MKKCVLGDICTKIGSGATPTGGRAAYAEEGVSLIRSQNVLDLTFSYGGLAYLNDSQADKLKSVAVQPNDVLLNITGDSVARSCMVDENALPARVNQHVAIVRVKKEVANPYYIMLWLVWQKKRLLLLASNGATRHALTKEMIEELPIDLPTLAEQSKIALLLSTIDRKIALNRKRIATLEAMAKEIYDYWFVQFDFPDAHGRPYKSSGGAMVYNPDLKREIPKEWVVRPLGELMKTNASSYNERTLPSRIQYVDIAAVSNGVVSSKTEYDSDHAPGRARRIAKRGDTIWSSVRPNLRAYALVLSPQGNDVFSTGFTVLSPIDVPYGFLYLTVTAEAYVSYLISRTGNSAYPAVLPSAFGEYEIAVPPRDLLDRFADQTEGMFELRQNCFDEIQIQTSLRDFLLPVLMNGQVKVG